jgi:hypothetical protein
VWVAKIFSLTKFIVMNQQQNDRPRNLNVRASNRLVRSVADYAITFLKRNGFKSFGRIGNIRVLARPIIIERTWQDAFFLHLHWGKVTIYQGLRKRQDGRIRIAAHKVQEGSVYNLEEMLATLGKN